MGKALSSAEGTAAGGGGPEARSVGTQSIRYLQKMRDFRHSGGISFQFFFGVPVSDFDLLWKHFFSEVGKKSSPPLTAIFCIFVFWLRGRALDDERRGPWFEPHVACLLFSFPLSVSVIA